MFIGEKAIINSKIVEACEVDVEQNGAVYEVLRVENGIPLFWEENCSRMINSIKMASIDFALTNAYFYQILQNLIINNPFDNCNIKLILTKSGDFAAGFIQSFYPPQQWYTDGVEVGIFEMVRPDPAAKIFRTDTRSKIEQTIIDEKVYEVALVNDFGNITEGSRSNILFFDKDRIYSAPTSQILEGITRKIVLKLCKQNHIEVVEQDIALQSISRFEAACITGTSPGVLPIKRLGNQHFDPQHALLQRVMDIFDECKNISL